jgi:hypothetical protein
MDVLGIQPLGEWERNQVISGGQILLWDDAVHERLESKQLYFWRLAFSPRYSREKVFENLAHFYEQAEITSYVVYETLGDFDLLLRVWAPRVHNAEELELLLRQSLEGCYLWNLNYLACKTEFHFSNNDEAAERPSARALERVGVPAIDLVNQYNEQQWRRHLDPDATAGSPIECPAELDGLLESGALCSIPLDTRGIRMFVTFDHPRQPLRPETRKWVVGQIRRKCDEIRQYWQGLTERTDSGEEIEIQPPNISIYAGAGSMTDFFVMARAPHKHFHAFVRQLIYGIRETGIDTQYEMRPYTHVIADRMFSEFKEHRKVSAEAGDIADLVQKDENESLELKATIATNFRSLIAANRREADPLMMDEVVKTVCGFLNSPKGGTLIIGVLEVRRELEKARDPGRYLEVLREDYGYKWDGGGGDEPPPNAVIGIGVDLDPGPISDPDAYDRYLRDTLKSRISPNPGPWLQIEIVELEGKKICLIWVRPGDRWFYAKVGSPQQEEFFVREGASTPALAGAESDLYKQAYPRGLPSTSEPPGHSRE